jgi:opacity protein-like surface antigen
MTSPRARHLAAAVLLVGLGTLCAPTRVSAQGFIHPFIGYNFGGDSGCPVVTDCEDKALNLGVGFGALGSVVGAEFEFGYIDQFLGKTPSASTKVMTFMGNFMLAPRFGPVQPYGLAGLGLIRTSVESVLDTNEGQNDFGWDIGGGLMVFFGDNIGVRGDLRYIKAFDALEILGLPIETGETKLDFGRVSGGVVFKF